MYILSLQGSKYSLYEMRSGTNHLIQSVANRMLKGWWRTMLFSIIAVAGKRQLKAGDKAPEFCSNAEPGLCYRNSSADYTVVYFYPEDDTPGCTLEAKAFSRYLRAFAMENTSVVGISPDSKESHVDFCNKYAIKVNLVSDESHDVLKSFGAGEKKNSLYGKAAFKVERCTFLVGKDGRIKYIWRNVKAKGHAEEVLAKVRALNG